MKKIFLFLIIFVLSITSCSANSDTKNYSLRFNGTKYHLLYSIKNKDFGGYLNEYYRRGETYNIWSDMVAIHHFPNAYSPIDRIKDFKDYLSSIKIPSSLTFDDKRNTAMIDFIVITDKMPIVLEFNIFKYEKSKKCGSVAVQYVKRYSATTTLQIEEIKKDFEKNRKHLIKKVKNFNIPQIVTVDIDKCISGVELNKQAKQDVTLQKNESIPEIVEENYTEEPVYENKSEDDTNTDVKKAENLTENNNVNNETFKESKTDVQIEEANLPSEKQTVEEDVKVQEKSIEQSVIIEASEQNINVNTKKKKSKADKNIKEVNYEVSNIKDEYFAKPRTKKELKELKKQNKKKLKEKNKEYIITNIKDEYVAKPRTNKEMKEYKQNLKEKQRAKQRAQKAKKKLSE